MSGMEQQQQQQQQKNVEFLPTFPLSLRARREREKKRDSMWFGVSVKDDGRAKHTQTRREEKKRERENPTKWRPEKSKGVYVRGAWYYWWFCDKTGRLGNVWAVAYIYSFGFFCFYDGFLSVGEGQTESCARRSRWGRSFGMIAIGGWKFAYGRDTPIYYRLTKELAVCTPKKRWPWEIGAPICALRRRRRAWRRIWNIAPFVTRRDAETKEPLPYWLL